ncbi:MAG: hypothetical protein OMM_00677 [Candidatus Magnetoglobus multicellularis str. Araruama]|uniref:Uncharacterized protein n=1 Tax=Candidatus Magnetoglobus multicellularis str. Araruama TaxID=890399 RepID=A0A1V1PGB4_9BACT|nr:MAG: hypothetical protein OMM_00677 [Candidatus Magnetoglobus multicellularis str. Araruama]
MIHKCIMRTNYCRPMFAWKEIIMNFEMIQNVLLLEDKESTSLIGRDQDMSELETLFYSDKPVIYVQGVTGVGKTVLVRNFLRKVTEKPKELHQIFWFSLPNIRTIEFMLNSMAAYSAQKPFFRSKLSEKVEIMAYIMSMRPHTIVIDNFEKATGKISEYSNPVFPDEEISLLQDLFTSLNGVVSKFILISSEPDELFCFNRNNDVFSFFQLESLDQEFSQQLATRILESNDIQVDINQKEMQQLMQIIDGHPMSMQLLLPRLQYQSPETLIAKYHAHRHHVMRIGQTTSDNYLTHLMALMDLVVSDLPSLTHDLLPPLSLYDGSIETDLFRTIVNIYQTSVMNFSANHVVRQMVKELVSFLEHNHLISKYIPGTENYIIVPILSEYLRRISMACETDDVRNGWSGAFVHVIARLAANLKSMDSYSKQIWCYFNNATFHNAYDVACEQNMYDHAGILMQIIAAFARVNRNYTKAETCFNELVGIHQSLKDEQMQGITMFQLAHIAEEQQHYKKAKLWLQRALDVFEKTESDYEAASVQHQMGRLCHVTGDLEIADRWLKLAYNSFTRTGESFEAADISRQLGRIGYEQKDYNTAEKWYENARDIFEMFGDEYRAANIYHQLGIIATDKRDYDNSKQWLQKARQVYEKMGMNEKLAAIYQQTAQIAHAQGEFEVAELYYMKTFGLLEKTDPYTAAILYKDLGKTSQSRGRYDQASQYYQLAYDFFDQLLNKNDPRYSELLFDMSILEGLKGHFEQSGRYLIESLHASNQKDFNKDLQYRVNNFKLSYFQAKDDEKKRLREYWEKHMGDFPIKGK